MHIVDNDGEFSKNLTDPNLKIPKAHLQAVCKKKQEGACRYVAITPYGCFCQKHTKLGRMVDARVAEGASGAIGDNCEGFKPSKSNFVDD
jgi:hypothetical protein